MNYPAARFATEKTVLRPVLPLGSHAGLSEKQMTSIWDDDEAKESIVVQQVDAIAIYRNVNEQIVICQKSSIGEDDAMIVFPQDYLDAVIRGLEKVR